MTGAVPACAWAWMVAAPAAWAGMASVARAAATASPGAAAVTWDPAADAAGPVAAVGDPADSPAVAVDSVEAVLADAVDRAEAAVRGAAVKVAVLAATGPA